jgi:ubiquinone/menaquinone biosynthesis C-methylase UbiE
MDDLKCKEGEECCEVERCDIFDFMAVYVGMTVLHPGGMKATARLAEKCRINTHSKVLDVACGKGTTSVYLAQKYGCEVTGIDISYDLIEEAEALAKKKGLENKVKFQVADAMNLPFADNTFDAAVSQAMLVLVKDQVKTIKEEIRVVKKGGHIGWLELAWPKEKDEKFLETASKQLCSLCIRNVNSYEGWEKLFRKAGAVSLDIHKSPLNMGSMAQMLRDEGFFNTMRIMFKSLTDKNIGKRMQSINDFFKIYGKEFGSGIFVSRK